MVPSSTKNVLAGVLSGQLEATTVIISDSLVQPALLLFRELIDTRLERGETVCLVCCELDANRFVESLCPGWNDTEKLARLTVFDSNLELESNASTNHQIRYKAIPFELDDASGLSNTLQEEVDLEHSLKTTVFVDSINALETFNDSSAILRFFRKCKRPIVAIHHTDVPTSPSPDASTSALLLPSLLTASGSRSSIHLTPHHPALLAHLYHVYGIENIVQSDPSARNGISEDSSNIDVRVYQFLHLLHQRGWGNPLLRGDDATSDARDQEGYGEAGGRQYDNPSSSSITLDLLGSGVSSETSPGRCAVEYALRGVSKTNKRSDASKVVRGLEGLRCTYIPILGGNPVARRLLPKLSVHSVSDVLRIKPRAVRIQGEKQQSNSEDPWSKSVFNLSITDRQREAREDVELPFTRGGGEANGSGAIIYEPDSADDLDDSDPDEDLEI